MNISKRANLEDKIKQRVKELWSKVGFYVGNDYNIHFVGPGGREFTDPRTFIHVDTLIAKGFTEKDIDKYFSTIGKKSKLYYDDKVKNLYWPMYNRVISNTLRKRWAKEQSKSKSIKKQEKEQQELANAISRVESPELKNVIMIGQHVHGKPYGWGKQSLEEGFDCSGFIYYVLNKAGIKTPDRTAAGMANSLGKKMVGRGVRLIPGDLLFWKAPTKANPKPTKINHVGLYLGGGKFIHSARKSGVSVSSITNPYYKKHLAQVNRMDEFNVAPQMIAKR